MPADLFSTVFKVADGGIMTDEVGVITGDVELESSLAGSDEAVARCRYDGANEWYVVSDASRVLGSGEDLQGFHEALVRKYRTV